MNNSLTFSEAPGIIDFGLLHNLFEHAQLVAWADGQIAKLDNPPYWLLVLATSSPRDRMKIVYLMPEGDALAVPEKFCGVLLALMPDPCDLPGDNFRLAVRQIYQIVRAVCGADWTQKILRDIDQIDDEFELLRQGYTSSTTDSLRADLKSFMEEYSLPDLAAELAPIRCQLIGQR